MLMDYTNLHEASSHQAIAKRFVGLLTPVIFIQSPPEELQKWSWAENMLGTRMRKGRGRTATKDLPLKKKWYFPIIQAFGTTSRHRKASPFNYPRFLTVETRLEINVAPTRRPGLSGAPSLQRLLIMLCTSGSLVNLTETDIEIVSNSELLNYFWQLHFHPLRLCDRLQQDHQQTSRNAETSQHETTLPVVGGTRSLK